MSILASSTPIRTKLAGDWTCSRCGFERLDSKTNATGMCGDCRLVEKTPVKTQRTRLLKSHIVGLKQPCKAWLRDFDDFDHPIYPDGTLVAPGGRLCGHRDCVEPTHIEDPDE